MLNCVFWQHILLEIEFKSRVDMGSDSNPQSVYCTAVSPMSGSPTFDTGKKKQKRGEFKTPPYPTGRRSNNVGEMEVPDNSQDFVTSELQLLSSHIHTQNTAPDDIAALKGAVSYYTHMLLRTAGHFVVAV